MTFEELLNSLDTIESVSRECAKAISSKNIDNDLCHLTAIDMDDILGKTRLSMLLAADLASSASNEVVSAIDAAYSLMKSGKVM